VLARPYAAYKWAVFNYQLAFSLNWVVFLFFYFIFFVYILNPSYNVAWWNAESPSEHVSEIVLNTLPFTAMLIEYPFN